MQPTAQDILRGATLNLEELVIPHLADPHARSAAMCIRTLLNHLALRLENGDRNLFDDSREKRALFAALPNVVAKDAWIPVTVRAGMLDASRRAGAIASVATLTTTAELTAENDALRAVMIDLLKTVHTAKAAMPKATFAALLAPIRAQLDREAERDNGTVLIDGPLF